MRLKTIALLVAFSLVSFVAGTLIRGTGAAAPKTDGGKRILYYICPMHPEYKSDKPGDAPCCGMRLEPVYEGAGGQPVAGERVPAGTVTVTAEKRQLVGVALGTVVRRPLTPAFRAVGRIVPDERSVYRLSPLSNGVIRKITRVTAGSAVKKGDLLVTYYTPSLRAAQQSYLVSLAGLGRQATSRLSDTLQSQVDLSLFELEALGMGPEQLEELRKTQRPMTEVNLRSPTSGLVLERNVTAGQQFDAGEDLFVIADLSRVWVVADLFEYESRHIRPGARAHVKYLGQRFDAVVSEVDPVFDAATRTLKVRLEMVNPGSRLRPDMFVDVEIPVQLPPSIVVPVDAVVDSGLRQTVFVERGDGRFEPREVETGWRYEDQVEIVSGLHEGERIVTSGTFLVDSESRMKAAAAGFSGTPAIDPVCGMEVDRAKAKSAGRTTDHGGKTQYFCSDDCKKAFDADPEGVLKKAAGRLAADRQEPRVAETKAGTNAAGTMPAGASTAAAAAVDPVCGMDVDRAAAKAAGRVSEHGGETYFFCSDDCKTKFDKDPHAFLKTPHDHGEAAGK